MSNNIVVIDGTRNGEESHSHVLGVLTDVLKKGSNDVQVFSVQDLKLANCIGCFGCWLETPGFCRYKEPVYQEIFKAWMHSDIVVLVTPVRFGGYSSKIKRIVERILPSLLPFMTTVHGEVHHKTRYSKSPRLLCIGIQDIPDPVEADTFKLVAGRHAVDMSAPSYAVEVIGSGESAERLRNIFLSLITRKDNFPSIKTVKRYMPMGDVPEKKLETNGTRRACLIVGSPKTLSNSTSSVLGNYVLERIKEQGWETESLNLNETLNNSKGEADLCSAVDRADLLILAFPLYVDALPFRMARALELIASHRHDNTRRRPLRLFAIANNGFPESYQNYPALMICRNFAVSTGMVWMGALALGAGEAIIGGNQLKERSHLGFPINKIHLALRKAAEALSKDQPVPLEAIRNLSGSPIPYTPFFVWKYLFLRHSSEGWEKVASQFGVNKQSMLAQPYAVNPAVSNVAI